MIKVNVWLPKESNVGHASVAIEDDFGATVEYISWWPTRGNNPLKRMPGTSPTFAKDIEDEGYYPDNEIRIHGLDEVKISDWWATFRRGEETYSLGGQNCSWVAINALNAGHAADFFNWTDWLTTSNFRRPILGWANFFVKTLGLPNSHRSLIDRISNRLSSGNSLKESATYTAVDIADENSAVWSPIDVQLFSQKLQSRTLQAQALPQPDESNLQL